MIGSNDAILLPMTAAIVFRATPVAANPARPSFVAGRGLGMRWRGDRGIPVAP